MTSDDLAFVEAERSELRSRAAHYMAQADAARKHADDLQEAHRKHVQALEGTIREITEKLAYQTRRAEANWEALCACRNEET